MVAAAVGGAAVVGAVATSQAGDKAADATKEAAKSDAATQLYMYNTSRDDFEPYRETGERALGKLSSLAGLEGKAANYDDFYKSPDYNFAYDQGMKSVEQSLAKRGLGGAGDSGAAMKALTRFGQGLASQQLGNYRNSLAALAGVGQTATGQTSTLGANAASQIGAAQQRAGDARASSYLNTGAAVNDVTNTYGQIKLLKSGGYIK
jgi:hypothetical protein